MNKLASIFYLLGLGMPTIYPRIITSGNERAVIERVNVFYYHCSEGWVLRCGELPCMGARLEPPLPWDTASTKEELVEKAIKMQKDIGGAYKVFCHEVMPMVRGGTMLVEGSHVLVEAGTGNPQYLSRMFRGKENPEQQVLFNPGMLSFRDSGKEVLGLDDFLQLRMLERAVNWNDLGAVASPVSFEFSRLNDGRFYVHDISVRD